MAPADILSIDDWVSNIGSSATDVLVFQNVYDDSVIPSLDPSFLPVNGRHNARTETREVGLFLRMFHSGLYRCAPLTGILSPKFNEKTRISGSEFLAFIEKNLGYDVYFVNPFPQNAYYTYNVWYHGELAHPGFMALAEILFERAGYDPKVMSEARDSRATLLYSSYWVGDQRFWNGYMTMITRLMETIQTMPKRLLGRYLSNADYRNWRSYDDIYSVSYLPFIFERTFSTYLHMNREIRALAFPFSREDVLDRCYGGTVEREIVRTFGDIVDEIDGRREYTPGDRQIIFSISALRAAAARHRWD
jgi:hypothetical protein